MNRKGQTVFMSFIFTLMIFMIGLLFINFIKPEISTARTSLECTDINNISDGNKLMCLFVGVTLPLFIWGIVSISGGIILAKII